ncbi:hypothetical protein [Haladaptatus halobius]|uniref:hypothetical protein n=1 Tax=Haladaptatus halobius TaxID=2884875 RepID=UPI001D0B5602|nr:hypothetical protein [Haladaptatus halobius]
MNPTFHASGDATLTIIDPIQRRQYPLQLSTNPHPDPADTSQFYFPVDNAVSVTTENIELPYVVGVYVRNLSGDVLVKTEEFAYEELPEREYLIELNGPIKVYLRVTSALTVASSTDRMELDFGTATRVQIGARSYHERPGKTITTTKEPSDMMKAISIFGSALKTTSCERSLPSLRGHPPQIKLGDEMQIPDELSVPASGVRIEVPPKLQTIYPVSSLAYYLGANVVPGPRPRLLTDRGFCQDLRRSSGDFESEVEGVLRQVFFFDCITRTEGYYQVDLHERQAIEEHLDLAFDELYEKSLAEQLEAYLEVPYQSIQDHLPTWPLTTFVTEEFQNIESLPFLVNNLSLIRTVESNRDHATTLELPDSVNGFVRSTGTDHRGEFNNRFNSYVALPKTDSLERAWLGTGNPVGVNKIIKKAFENKLCRRASTEGIKITVVCNDPDMSSEYDVGDSLYGERDELEFNIDVHRNLTVGELHAVFATETDFLHYIGHITNDEFVCRDGGLDVRNIGDVAVDTFLLNGCRSYEQGKRLIEAGSIGGVVTYSHVGNKSATRIGRLIARLLNRGFSLRSALTLAQEHQIVRNQYVVVGDGSVEIAQCENGTPMVCQIDPDQKNLYDVKLTTFPTIEQGIGSFYWPYIDEIQTYFLISGDLPSFTLSRDSLTQFLRLEQIPVLFENKLRWSTEIDLGDL